MRILLLVFLFSIGIFCPDLSLGQEGGITQSQDHIIISKIIIVGNKKTKEKIILRELDFASGDTLRMVELVQKIKDSKRYLTNTSLFLEVDIKPIPVNEVYSDILVTVKERWYFWPSPGIALADPNFNTWWQTKDFNRINFRLSLDQANFRGQNEKLQTLFQIGYTNQFGVKYYTPQLTKSQNLGFGVSSRYKQNNEAVYDTENNERVFYTETRGNAKEILENSVYFTLRGKYNVKHSLELGHTSTRSKDTVTQLNSNYFGANKNGANYFSIKWETELDFRDRRSYPLTGFYANLKVTKSGLGIFNDVNVLRTKIKGQRFWKLNKKWFLASALTYNFTPSKHIPYFLVEAIGLDDKLRGYEYYVIDGNDLTLLQSNLKYELLKTREVKIRGLKSDQFNTVPFAFYLNFFADMGYARNDFNWENNTFANRMLYSAGIGLDFVTYYDKVIRFETSMNHLGEIGLYLHFTQPF